MNTSGMSYSNREEEVSVITRSLKALAMELNIPIIAFSQLNRGKESREGIEGKRPQLSDLRESRTIEQDADMICFIHRPEYYKIYQDEKENDLHGMAEIIVAKNRNGKTGNTLLKFSSQFARFDNIADNISIRKKATMRVKSFKFKVIRDSESIILSLNFSDLSIEVIRQLISNSIKLEANKECKLLFIGNIDCKLELEDILTLLALYNQL